MAVEICSPVFNLDVGEKYSGEHEKYLIDNGYAKRTGNTSTDVSASVTYGREDDPTLAENREAPNETPADFAARATSPDDQPESPATPGDTLKPADPLKATASRTKPPKGSVNETTKEKADKAEEKPSTDS